MSVSLRTYACETSPCDEREAASKADYHLEWSLDGSDWQPCDGTLCGERSEGCGSDPNGTYRIVARRGQAAWETSIVVDDYSCTMGGATVELLVGDPPPPGRCEPTAEKVYPVAGTLAWQMGDWGATVDATTVAEQGAIQSNLDLWLADPESNEVSAAERVLVTTGSGETFFAMTLFLDDLRAAQAGSSFVVGLDNDGMTTLLAHPCAPPNHCRARGDEAGATVTVDLAEGGPAPWPNLVTEDYVRRYRIRYEADDLLASAASTSDCEGCTEPLWLSFDLTFERRASEFALWDDGVCLDR
ncbi:MAG: hypothetical protein JRI23_06655 [Deltaproteobacteria bacterium]|nr:hypothetical protein [Deltaproteobacteria bacterium]MBW2531268.1 hypothetical protein [Deltaproteobacteria bacterium]